MRIGFLIHRKPFLKVLGPLIKESMKRGDHVVLLYTIGSTTGEKSYQNVDTEYLIKTFGNDADLMVFTSQNLAKVCLKAKVSALVTLEGYYHASNQDYLGELVSLKNKGVQLISLSHFFEFILRPQEALDLFDQSIYLSDYQVKLHFDLLGDKNGELQSQYVNKHFTAGSPIFDLIASHEHQNLRDKFNIPKEKKVVLLMSPILTPATPWRHRIWREPSKLKRSLYSLKTGQLGDLPEIWFGKTFRDSVNAIRKFCDHENAFLIVKSRGKHTDPTYLIEAADVFIDGMDDDFFPSFTTYEILSITDLCITVMSMTALEAAIAQVPVANIYVPHLDFAPQVTEHYLKYIDILMDGSPKSLMNTANCVNMVSYKDFPNWILQHAVDNIPWDEQACKEYTGNFLGMADETSSERTLRLIDQSVIGADIQTPAPDFLA